MSMGELDLTEVVPLPPLSSINLNLTRVTERLMRETFGVPGPLGQDCSDPYGGFSDKLVWGSNVGPFKVNGLPSAVASLQTLFRAINRDYPSVHESIKSAGMLCVRARRSNANTYSNHSWGTAIDLYFGDDVLPQGKAAAQRGIAIVAPYFNNHGWFWGAGFEGQFVDSMHFELSREAILGGKEVQVKTVA